MILSTNIINELAPIIYALKKANVKKATINLLQYPSINFDVDEINDDTCNIVMIIKTNHTINF